MATLVVLSGCTFPFGKGNDGDGVPVDNVDVSDAYFGLAWYRSGTTLNPVMDAPRSTACCVRRFTRDFLR